MSPWYLKSSRHFHRTARKRLKKLRRIRREKKGIPQKISVKLPSAEINLGLQFHGRCIDRYERENYRHVIRIPARFSFTENADAVLDVLHTVTDLARRGVARIHFDFRPCNYLGIAASIVLDIIVLELRDAWKKRGVKFRLSGSCPHHGDTDVLFRSLGMIKQLDIKNMDPDDEEKSCLVTFELFSGHRSSPLESSLAEKACTCLADYLNDCFQKAAGYSLTDDGKRQIMAWAGEIITNAEEHSATDKWWAIGYMRINKRQKQPVSNPSHVGECHLAIFNFGRSIHQSLMDTQTPEATRNALSDLVSIHKSQSLFSFVERYSEADLVSLYSLQEGVSRCNSAPGKEDRGNGTVRLIRAFQDLGNSVDPEKSPSMALISGSSRILFNEKFKMQLRGERMTIAFNSENDLYKRPSKDNVHSLRARFPGTLLSFNFYIDRRYLDKLTNNNE